jgi:hypothetical protein
MEIERDVEREQEKETQRYKIGAGVAAAAAVLLFASLFLNWYQLDAPTGELPSYNAFERLERSDIYLVILCVAALAVAAAGFLPMLRRFGLGQWGLTAVGALAVVLVLYRGSERPGVVVFGKAFDTTLEFGWYVSLLAALAMAAGGVWALSGRPRRPPSEEDELEDEEPGTETPPHRTEEPSR